MMAPTSRPEIEGPRPRSSPELDGPRHITPVGNEASLARNLVGTQIGQYRVVRRIGQGGMGTVYEAVHVQIGQRAAVKVLNPNLAGRESYARRFIDEARVVGKVGHPGLIKVFDFGKTADRDLYILMEFLEGEELWDRIKPLHSQGEKLPLRDSLRIARQVASALGAVHAQNIIHRDLKPENVFLVHDPDSPSGERAKVLDFGIAKLTEGESGGRRTTTGTALGTPTYMSPEQCEGSPDLTDRVDVYALGVMLYELLAGKPPFEGNSMGAIMRMHIVVPPPPLPPSVPPEVRALVESMLQKLASDRPAMSAVVVRLDEILGGTPSSTALPVLPPPAQRRWLVPAVAAAVVLAILGLSAGLLMRGPSTPRPASTSGPAPTGSAGHDPATGPATPPPARPEGIKPGPGAPTAATDPGKAATPAAPTDAGKTVKKKPVKKPPSGRWGALPK
ncbi:MAG: serine/threonine-protein kinase [Polyangia bacterium]